MPFKSKAQQKFMFANHPAIARRWAQQGGNSNLPAELSATLPNGQSRDKKGQHAAIQRRLQTKGGQKKANNLRAVGK